MQVIPVDVARLGACMVLIPPAARVDQDGVQRKARDGRLQWVVNVGVRRLDRRAADVVDVVVTGAEPVAMPEGTRVRLVDLEGVQWERGDMHGVSWRAAEVVPVELAAGAAAVAPAAGRGKGGEGR